ncbi:hypothetical protein [Silvimonas amylolytica]|uniref:Uncharacterized protein n=1 Tax=Silvimonas amylolytica TaxID=449663 RepID=A0ABQ2PQE4_9NEIS|nr:hypothetical protein [Silvimonas amylolytica]GGP27611.1 hypothetical protein GCM10010971_34300 [Silvimonas amylolytica]
MAMQYPATAGKPLIYIFICNYHSLDKSEVFGCGTSTRYGLSGAANPVTEPEISLNEYAAQHEHMQIAASPDRGPKSPHKAGM